MHTQTKLGAKSVPRFARNIFRSRNDNTFNIVLVGVVAPFGKLEVSFTPKNLTSYSPDRPSKGNVGREIGSALPKNKFPTAPRQHPQHCFGGWDVGAAPFGKPEVSFGARCSIQCIEPRHVSRSSLELIAVAVGTGLALEVGTSLASRCEISHI